MKAIEFKTWMEAFNRMSRGQRDTLREQLQGKVKGDQGVKLIEQSLADVSACPHCGSTELYRWGNSCDLQRYRCRHCQRTFNALTHTPLARLRRPLDSSPLLQRGVLVKSPTGLSCLNKPILLPVFGPSILACGAWLKNTICVTRGNQAYVSQYIGDLDSAEARLMLEQSVTHLCADLDVQPEMVAHDLHPDFYSTQFAQSYAAQLGLPIVAVQHHHAHIAALCAEHGVIQPVLGLALDGVGLGTDGTPWGGELLRVEGANFQRLGHLAPLNMPGGDRAAREPWRMAAAVLFQLGRGDEIAQRFPGQPGAKTVATMLQRGLNCPATSSMGRLFDAAAGLLGVSEIQTFEAQAAMLLQNLAERHGQIVPLAEGYRIADNRVLDFSPLLAVLSDCRDASYGAALFHATLAAGLAEWVECAAGEHNITYIALGGGCFHNDILLRTLSDRLAQHGLQVLTAQQMQPNDSAISLGQAWIALQTIKLGI